jgi:hypothetical protein
MFELGRVSWFIRAPVEREGELTVEEKLVVEGSFITPEAVAPSLPAGPVPLSAAAERFRTCRWRRAAEDGIPECCGHRDVLPITGANGFDPSAWCADCGLFKLRRTPKKREDYGERY